MTRKRVYSDYLRDIAHYAAKAQQFVAGLDYEQFVAHEEKGLAVLHALQIIGEAAAHLPRSIRQRYFVSSLLQAILGFGSALVAVPLALLFLPKETVVSSIFSRA